MQWDDNGLKENDVFFSQRHSESTDNTGQDIKQLGGSIELEVLVNKGVEAAFNDKLVNYLIIKLLCDCFSDHFSSWDELGVQSVEDVLQVLSLLWLFRVEQFQELFNVIYTFISIYCYLLDEGVQDEDFQGLHVGGFVHDQLQEELVDRLQIY